MGETQLLLIVLGVLLAGVAIFVGVGIFGADTAEHTQNAITHDLQDFSAHAIPYYSTPTSQGGGNKSFRGLTI